MKIQSGEHVTDTQQTHDQTAALILQLPNPLLDPSHQALTVPRIPFQAEPQEGGDKKRPEDFSVELAVRACHVTCDRTGEGGPAQGCRVACAGLLAPGGNGQPGARGTVGPGESDTVGGWVWAAPPGSGSSSAGWLEHTEEATQSGLEAGGQSKPGWGLPGRPRTCRLLWWQEVALGAQCWESQRPRPHPQGGQRAAERGHRGVRTRLNAGAAEGRMATSEAPGLPAPPPPHIRAGH